MTMQGVRIYPDEPAGPFPTPPISFRDGEGRPIVVRVLDPDDDAQIEALVEMYRQFDPAERAQGIPPTRVDRIRDWLGVVVEDGPDVVAWHDERAVGHATLVPDGSGVQRGHGQGGAGDPADGADTHAGEGDESTPHELAIFVLQAYQRAGIGRQLLTGLLGHGDECGIDRVWLTVERWNRPAIDLYDSVGFEVCGSERFEQEMALRLG